VAMEVRHRQRCGRGQVGSFEVGRVVVAAQGEAPLRSDGWLAAAGLEGAPGYAALDGPAFVPVLPVVEGAIQPDGRLHAELRQRSEALIAAGAARGEEQLQLRVEGVDLELVVVACAVALAA